VSVINPSVKHDSIKRWTLIRLGLFLLIVGSGFFLFTNMMLAKRFDRFEVEQYQQELSRVRAVFQQDSQALAATIVDYGNWDDSYGFISSHDVAFLKDNFSVEQMRNVRIDGVLILNLAGETVASLAVRSAGVTPLLPSIVVQLKKLAAEVGQQGLNDGAYHVIWQGQTPILVVLAQVNNNSSLEQPSNGQIFMLRNLDAAYVKHLSELTGVAFNLQPAATMGSSIVVEQKADGWTLSQALDGLDLRISVSGTGRLTGERSATVLALALNVLLLAVFSLAGIYAILHHRVLQRLALFSEFADQHREDARAQIRWPVIGNDELDNLASSLNELMTEVEHQHGNLRHLADHDPLTSLGNRRLLMARLEYFQGICRRQPQLSCMVLLLDLDSFKSINDSLGHAAGDWVLQQVATRIAGLIRERDTAVRLGGDEFALLLRDIDAEQAHKFAQRIQQALEVPTCYEGRMLTISASTGIAQVLADTTPAEVLRNADLAMYEAKRLGKKRVAIFASDLLEAADRRLHIEQSLRASLEAMALEVWFQPIIDGRTASVVGMEALARWSIDGTYIAPDEFIAIAENSGMITKLGDFVLERSCTALQGLRGEYPDLSCNVNISVRQFSDTNLLRDVHACLAAHGLPACALHLELTESMVAEHETDLLPLMQALVRSGVHFHLDDFGTGYSSLDRLRTLPINTLKIDRCFVTPLNTGDEVMARNIINLAQELGLNIIAEGVETAEECARLLALGCTQMQGYLFARPMPLNKLVDWLRSH
jgi:diguanylate cyclase (GGDEF)-like protein